MRGFLLPVLTLWWREVLRFCRQRSRLYGALSQPLVLWLLLGAGMSASFRPPGTPPGTGYAEYFYPGILALVLLFTAVFSTISTVVDRREGFLQSVLVAPVGRARVVLGQALGGTTLALFQGAILLLLAPLVGVRLSAGAVLATLGVLSLLAFGMTNLGLLIAWRMESIQGFHAIMNLILIPGWLLSGAFFPITGVPGWLGWVMRADPLTYGMAALRRCLYLANPAAAGEVPPLGASLGITALFCLLAFLGATWSARRAGP